MTEIKPLYIHVPGQACATPCAYCMTRHYMLRPTSCLDEHSPHYTICKQDYYKRMAFARGDAGCNAIFIVGNCEPQKNRAFLERIAVVNNMLARPFRIIELTTTGRSLTRDYLYFLRSVVGVTTIDLNVASFNDALNQELAGMSKENKVELLPLTKTIKDLTFNLHLHIYLSKYFDIYKENPEQFFKDCEGKYGAQYLSCHGTPAPNEWLQSRKGDSQTKETLAKFVKEKGVFLTQFPSYADVYTYNNLIILMDPLNIKSSTVSDSLILQTDGRLYTKWDEKTSLVF